MASLSRVKRLFTIKTRFEAFLVIFAIAMGAAERGRHYLETYGTGTAGILLALACTGVVFIAGAKLLDAVKREAEDEAMVKARAAAPLLLPRRRGRPVSRNRPRLSLTRRSATSRSEPRTG